MSFGRGFSVILALKLFRVATFSYISIVLPAYLYLRGFSPVDVGIVLLAMTAGNALSNMVILGLGHRVGERSILVIYSALIMISGIMLLAAGRSLPLIAAAGLIGNVSTGTETGPFQSIESSGLTRFAPERLRNRAYGLYNLMGFLATAVGALVVSVGGRMAGPSALYRGGLALLIVLGAALLAGYNYVRWPNAVRRPLRAVEGRKLGEVYRLSALFFVDGFGGGFVTQSALSLWFLARFHVNLDQLGSVFLAVSVITSVSVYLSSYLSDRIGNVRTMVYTHLASNLFLALVALSPTFPLALAFLLMRQSVSQMDVPARQSLMAYLFSEEERVYAVAITNVARSVSYVPASYITGLLIGLGYLYLPVLSAALIKGGYDLTFYKLYKDVERR